MDHHPKFTAARTSPPSSRFPSRLFDMVESESFYGIFFLLSLLTLEEERMMQNS